jgi:hypothetical protein
MDNSSDVKIIEDNWNKFIGLIESHISNPRKNQLLDFYNKHDERIATAPYSARIANGNCYPGGYIEHVLRVCNGAIDLHNVWQSNGSKENYTLEELMFVAINHEIGLIGTIDHELFKPNQSDWHIKNRGELYVYNEQVPYSTISDRSIFLLQEAGISFSYNEMLGIKTYMGLYDKSNENYLTNWIPEARPRTALIHIIHQASLMAKYIGFEKDYLSKLEVKEPKVQVVIKEVPSAITGKIVPQTENVIKTEVSESLDRAFAKFFNK